MVLQKFDDDDDYFLPSVTMIRAEGGLKIIIIYALNSIEPEGLKHNKLRKRTCSWSAKGPGRRHPQTPQAARRR